MRFLHCGDIHIGAGRSDNRERDFAEAFYSVACLAVEQKVDFCLITGDLFDRREINPRALSEAARGLSVMKEAEIPVYAIEGNHDKALYVDRDSWMDYLDAQGMLRLLRRRGEGSLCTPYEEGGNVDELGGVRIVGLPYAGTRTRELAEALGEELPHYPGHTVVMLHCPVGGQMAIDNAYLPSSTIELLKKKADYIALGHIHTAYTYQGIAYNPGAPESVRADEGIGKEKGVYLVELMGDGAHRAELIPIRRRPSKRVELALTEMDDAQTATERILEALREAAREEGLLLTLCLTGCPGFDPSLLELGEFRSVARELRIRSFDLQMRLQSREGTFAQTMDMASLERQVIAGLWKEKGYDGERMMQMTLQVKERVLSGGEGVHREIAVDLERFCEGEHA